MYPAAGSQQRNGTGEAEQTRARANILAQHKDDRFRAAFRPFCNHTYHPIWIVLLRGKGFALQIRSLSARPPADL